MNRIGFYICCLLLLFATNTIAQVTIGSGFPPAKGALLDLKQNDYVSENSTKGVLFPRVMLSNEHELYPMFGTEGKEIKEYTDNRNKLKIEHKGLIVYNLSEENRQRRAPAIRDELRCVPYHAFSASRGVSRSGISR